MTDPQQNQFDAAEVAYEYLTDSANAPIWTSLEAFAEGVAAVDGSLNILHTLIQIQGGKTEGITANKQRLRQSISTRLVRLAKACIPFGKATGNDDLVAQANALNSASEIEEIKDGLLADRAQDLYNRALAARDADAATAAKYGFKTGADDKLLAPLLAAVTAYSPVAHGPQAAINARADATAAIDTELRRLRATFQDLDNLSAQFEDEHADFVTGYQTARKTIHRGGGGESEGDKGTTEQPIQPGGK